MSDIDCSLCRGTKKIELDSKSEDMVRRSLYHKLTKKGRKLLEHAPIVVHCPCTGTIAVVE